MEQLKTYLRNLQDDEARAAFAADAGTSLGHLKNVMYLVRPCSPELAACIERLSGKAVTRRDLRPEDWHRIWPELVTAQHPAPRAKRKAAA